METMVQPTSSYHGDNTEDDDDLNHDDDASRAQVNGLQIFEKAGC